MTRRGAGEGTIRQRADGRWEARYRTRDGKRRSVFASTRRDVQEELRRALDNASKGITPADGRLTTKAYLEMWIRNSVRPRLRPTTADSYAWIVEKYLTPEVGKIPLAKLEPAQVQRAIGNLSSRKVVRKDGTARPLSPTTVRYATTVLRVALGRAARQGLVPRNAALLADPPSKARRDLVPLTADQAKAFLESVRGDRLEALWVAAIGLGMRQGELLALRWSDLDLDAGTLSVRHTLRRSTLELAEPKTERSRRTLVMPPFVTTALREHRGRQAEEQFAGADGYVFATTVESATGAGRRRTDPKVKGRPLMARNVTRSFHAALERAGLPRQRFHDLRHASATLLLEQGADLDEVSRVLGHSTYSTTADVYAHFTRARSQAAADRMEAKFGGRRR